MRSNGRKSLHDWSWMPFLIAFVLALSACSPARIAADFMGNALASGGNVYASDEDPELVREAIPFGLKTLESLHEASPDNRNILLALASGFTSYAYLLQDEADRLSVGDYKRAKSQRARASRLYLRGRYYALTAISIRHPGFLTNLRLDPAEELGQVGDEDTPFLYWAGASWAGAVGAQPGNLDLVADLPIAASLVERVIELDDAFDRGAAYEFMIAYEASRPGGNLARAEEHYWQALKYSDGRRASVHLALAENVTVRAQDPKRFVELLDKVEAVDPDLEPSLRLANTLSQRRAIWLRTRISDLFIEIEPEESES